ncbi:hypothetical protein KSS87_019077, partial [Heliosperma pusillum]
MKQGRVIVHKGVTMQIMEDSLFSQGVTMQTMGNKAKKTQSSLNELQCIQWVMKQGRLIVH